MLLRWSGEHSYHEQPYGVRSPVASDVLLSALDGHHVAVDYRGYRILAEERPSIARTHFPFCIVTFRYFVRVPRTRAYTIITLIITWLDAFTHPGEKFRIWLFVNRTSQRERTINDPVLFDTVVQHWLLPIDRDRIAVGLSLSLHPVRTNWLSYKFVETRVSLDNQTPTAFPLHHTVSVTLINPDREQCGEDRR